MKVSSTSIQVCRSVYIPYFKINVPIFCCPLFFEECLNPQVRINKMENEHTVDYHLRPSKLTSRIHPLIFLWTPKRFISPESFLKFFSNLYIYPTNRGCGKQDPQQRGRGPSLFMNSYFARDVFLENCFSCHSPSRFHFCSFPQAKLSPRQKEITYFILTAFSENLFFPQQKDGENYGAEKMNKIKLLRVLVTSFDKFHHLCNLYIFYFYFAVP